jgi:Uma2 family endonuclease
VFFNHFERAGGIVMFAPLRLQIRPGKYREPDLMLLQTIQDPRRENRFWTGADLVLEVVSEDKPDRDLIEKKEAYAEAVIPEYWIVNPLNASVTVLRLQSGSYLEFGVYHRGENALSALHPGFSFSVDSLFDAGKVP